MDAFTLVISLGMVSVVAFMVGYPLIKTNTKARYESLLEEAEKAENSVLDKEAIFTAINEIEFDYKMNKLTDDDYNFLKNRYKEAALNILHEEEIEEFTNNTFKDNEKDDLEAEIEQEIEKELQLKG